MDPLSIAGSIAGLISLSDTIFRKLYHYVKEVESAEKEVKELKNEVAALNGVLHNLHLIAQDLETSSPRSNSIRPDHINSCLATLYQLDERIKKVGISDKGKIRATIHKLSWPFKAVNTKKFIEDIRNHRDHLNFALSADTMAALLQCLSKQNQILSGIADLETRLRDKQNIDTKILVNEERQKVLDNFLSVNPEDLFRTNTRIRHATTGFWLTETDEFTKWMRGSNLHLWLSGIPGAGKTILSSLIIQQCLKQATDDRASAFFYCDYKNAESQDAVKILSSIASQLARQHESCFQLLKDYDNELRPQYQLQRSPEIEELIDLLRKMSDYFEDVRLIVDGIDECNEHAGEVASTLKSLGDGHAVISMCLISRDELDIRTELEAAMFEHIEIAAHTEDIEHYVRSEIEERLKRKKLRLRSSDLKEEIVHQLVTRAEGMFRWVSCQLDHLCELPTDALRRKALTCLPSTLNETYARVLTRIEESARPLVRRTLQWIAYAVYPGLSIEQLSEIVSIDEEDKELDPEACPDPDDLLRYCGSLIRRTNSSHNDSSHSRLELAHFTVQGFLEAISQNDTELNQFCLSPTDTLILARTCLNYLSLPSFDRPPSDFEDDLNEHPFYQHVSKSLMTYIHKHAYEDDLEKHLQRLFRPPKSYNLTRFALHCIWELDIESTENGWIDKVCSYEFTSIHVAAMLWLERVCRWLLEEGCNVNQTSALGTPLEWAVLGPDDTIMRHRDISISNRLHSKELQCTISTLLKAGAAWDADGIDTESLLLAVSTGPTKFLIEMLRHGMPLSTRVCQQIDQYANRDIFIKHLLDSIDGVEDAKVPLEVRMQLLNRARAENIEPKAVLPIDRIASTMRELSDDTYAKVIVYTAKYGPVSDLLRLTTDKRFSANMKGPGRSATLLHIAAEHNSLECMELLLDENYDPTHLGEHGQTALHCAIESGVQKLALLRRLVQSNATEIVDCYGRNVWHMAAKRGRLDVLDLLIAELGPDHPYFYMQSNVGRTPLLEAIRYRKSHIASRILRSLASVKTFRVDPRVIYSVVGTGLEGLLEELVEMGADLHTRSDHDQNALYFITRRTTTGMLRKLLDHGLDVNHLDSYGKSPLLDFLEVDQHTQRLEALGCRNSSPAEIDLSVAAILATPFCAITQDKENNSTWFYFCTKMLPSWLTHRAPCSKPDSLISLSDILIQKGALEAYEESSTEFGIALLVKMCLDTISELDSENSDSEYSYSEDEEDYNDMVPFVKSILQHVLDDITANNLFAAHSQAVRLLIWSIAQSDNDVCEQLIRLGVDLHATCDEYYGENSAVDIAIERMIGEKLFDMILAHADPVRIPKPDANDSMRHFVLCHSAKPSNGQHAIQSPVDEAQGTILTPVSKLERLLRKGIDPDARSVHGWTAASTAAAHGQLECMKLLVAYSADLLLTDSNGWTVIHCAITSGHLILLKYLRQVIKQDEEWTRSATFLTHDSELYHQPLEPLSHLIYLRCSPTHFAAYNHRSDILQFLRDENVVRNIDAEAQDGVTPLHFAVCMKSPQTTRWLLENGADIKLKCGKRNISALHIAMRWGRLENAIALVEAGAEFCTDSAGITPEMQVDPTICEDLLELLPNVGVPISPIVIEIIRQRHQLKSSGNLYQAIVNGDFEACDSIIASAPCLPKVVEGCGPCTPLIVALAHGQMEIAKLFLDHGASTNGAPCAKINKSNRYGSHVSALDVAIRNPVSNSILEQLLEQCLLHETHWSQRFGYWQPFHLAAAFNPGAIRMLANHVLKHTRLFRDSLPMATGTYDVSPFSVLKAGLESQGTDIDGVSVPKVRSGCSTLHVAVMNNKPDAIDALLEYGVDANVRDANGGSPLHYAAHAGSSILVEKLLEAGAKPDAVDCLQKTPLMIAARAGAKQAASMLVEHGASLTAVNYVGRTALHYAARGQSTETFIFLLDSGCDPYQLDDEKHSPVYYSLSQNRLATYIYAHCLDLTHLVDSDEIPIIGPGIHALRSFFFYSSKLAGSRFLTMRNKRGDTVLIENTIWGDPDRIRVCTKAGMQLETTRINGDTALLAACRAARLSSVAYLVRQGAKLEYEHGGRTFNAYVVACEHPEIIEWLLVKRWTEQGRLGSEPANSGEQAQSHLWTGVRTVKIPLRGDYERPEGSSLLDHAIYLHGIAKEGWRILVPLGWDTVANLVPLSGEA
ncbi:unnamed protein product [Alternaria alternata]